MPTPAPSSIATSWPRLISSGAPAGVNATRYSSCLISFATPIRMPRGSLQMPLAHEKEQPDNRFRVLALLDQRRHRRERHAHELELLALLRAGLAPLEPRCEEQVEGLVGEA